ncbi:MAG: hypothetical protein QXK08_00540 [Candidatus Woesearchaeota archaeon]
MNRRAAMGRALTFIASAGVIALLLAGFFIASSMFHKKAEFDVTASTTGLKASGQLRLLVSVLADEISSGNYARVGPLVSAVYGPQADFALYIDASLVAGRKIGIPDASIDALLPKYDGSIAKVRLEVGQK